MKRFIKIWLYALCIIYLCGCAGGNEPAALDMSEEADAYNLFFTGEENRYYNAVFEGDRECKAELFIDNVKEYENGTLYHLYVNEESLDSTFERWGNEPFDMGYIFVCSDKIYFLNYITEEEALLLTEEEITDKGDVVCQEESKEDVLQENEKGWHEYIVVDGDRCEYHGWNDLVETGWYQSFTWEKKNGLVGFRCGFGAGRGHMELSLTE